MPKLRMSRARGGQPAYRSSLQRVGGYCWRHRGYLFVSVAGTIFAAALSLLIPLVQRQIIDQSVLAHHDSVWPLAIVLVLAALLIFIGSFLRFYVSGHLAAAVQHDLRTEMFESLLKLDGAAQDELGSGQAVSRSISDITNVVSALIWGPTMLGNTV